MYYNYHCYHLHCIHRTSWPRACHPCAGAMLIFSVSFQFQRMIPEGNPYIICLHHIIIQKCIAYTELYFIIMSTIWYDHKIIVCRNEGMK